MIRIDVSVDRSPPPLSPKPISINNKRDPLISGRGKGSPDVDTFSLIRGRAGFAFIVGWGGFNKVSWRKWRRRSRVKRADFEVFALDSSGYLRVEIRETRIGRWHPWPGKAALEMFGKTSDCRRNSRQFPL